MTRYDQALNEYVEVGHVSQDKFLNVVDSGHKKGSGPLSTHLTQQAVHFAGLI